MLTVILCTLLNLSQTSPILVLEQDNLVAQNSQRVVSTHKRVAVKRAKVKSVQVIAKRQGLSDDLDFINRTFPFTLDKNLAPELEAVLLPIWILNILTAGCAGQVWLPMVLTNLEFDDDYLQTALLSWLMHMVGGLLINFVVTIGTVLGCVNLVYLGPVASLNIANRHIKGRKHSEQRKYHDGWEPQAPSPKGEDPIFERSSFAIIY